MDTGQNEMCFFMMLFLDVEPPCGFLFVNVRMQEKTHSGDWVGADVIEMSKHDMGSLMEMY